MNDLSDRLFLFKCLRAALSNQELLQEYDRLYGTNLSQRGAPFELLIDQTTERLEAEFPGFVEFVRKAIYEPLMAEKEWSFK